MYLVWENIFWAVIFIKKWLNLVEIYCAGIATHLDICFQYLCSYVKWNCCVSSLKISVVFPRKKMSIIRRPVTYSAGLVNLLYFWKPSFHEKLVDSFALKIQIYNHGERAIAPSCCENMNESNSKFLTKEAEFSTFASFHQPSPEYVLSDAQELWL